MFRPALVAGFVALLAVPASAAELDDPMRPSSRSAPAAVQPGEHGPVWRLDSTIVGTSRRIAVINGRSLSVGQSVGGAKLIEILPGRVLLDQGGRQFALTLVPGDIKQLRE